MEWIFFVVMLEGGTESSLTPGRAKQCTKDKKKIEREKGTADQVKKRRPDGRGNDRERKRDQKLMSSRDEETANWRDRNVSFLIDVHCTDASYLIPLQNSPYYSSHNNYVAAHTTRHAGLSYRANDN